MTFKVLLHLKAAKELQKTETPIRARIVESAKQLREKSDKTGKPIEHSDFWSLRIGDYCVIYEIDQNKKRVIILFVGHRNKVCDDFSKML